LSRSDLLSAPPGSTEDYIATDPKQSQHQQASQANDDDDEEPVLCFSAKGCLGHVISPL
jgi:hypothetical protein